MFYLNYQLLFITSHSKFLKQQINKKKLYTIMFYSVEIEDSFSVKLKNGYTIHAGPPPGSGIILAFILRILDGILPAPNAGLDAHRLVEAFKFGYGERTHLGDHKFVNVSQVCFIKSTL